MISSRSRTFPLISLSGLELHHVEAEIVTYRGRQVLPVAEE